MTLYRKAVTSADESRESQAFLNAMIRNGWVIEVEPVEMLVECPNRVGGDPQAGCDKCGGEGFVVARVVVVEDTE